MTTRRPFRGLLLSLLAAASVQGASAQGDTMGGCCLADYAFCLPMTADECRNEPLNLGWQEGDVDKCTSDLCCVPDGMGCLIDADCCGGSACGEDGLCRKSYCCIRETNGLPRLSDDREYLDQDGVGDCVSDPAVPGVTREIVFDPGACTQEVFCCNPNSWLAGEGNEAQRCAATPVPTELNGETQNPCGQAPYDGFVYADAGDCLRGCGQAFSCIRQPDGQGGLQASCERDPLRVTLPRSYIQEAGDAADVIDERDPDAVDAWLYRPYMPAGDETQGRRVYDCGSWCGQEYAAVCARWCADDDPGARVACAQLCPGYEETGACGEDCQAQCRSAVCLDEFRTESQCEAACGNPALWEAMIGGGGMRAEPPWPGFPNGYPFVPAGGEPVLALPSSRSSSRSSLVRSSPPAFARISSVPSRRSSVASSPAASSVVPSALSSVPASSAEGAASSLRPAAPVADEGGSFPWWLLLLLLLLIAAGAAFWLYRRTTREANDESA